MSNVPQKDKDQLRYDMMRDDYEADSHDSNMKDIEYATKHLKSTVDIIPTLTAFRDLCKIYDLDFDEYLDYMKEDL